jgi:hypothetical protein
MRMLVALTVVLLLTPPAPAGAETRIFIVENQPDGYGVDQCLANGANCGKPVASAYCQSRKYSQAVSFRKAEREEITGSPTGDAICRTAAASTSSPSSASADQGSVIGGQESGVS